LRLRERENKEGIKKDDERKALIIFSLSGALLRQSRK
jgi:hypothetical protein